MDYILLDDDGKITEVTIWWRPLPAGVRIPSSADEADTQRGR